MYLAHAARRLKAIIGLIGDVIKSGEDRLEGKGLPSAFSERGSMTRSTSAAREAAGFTSPILRSSLLRVADPRSGICFAIIHF
jgi:hypothetical protein